MTWAYRVSQRWPWANTGCDSLILDQEEGLVSLSMPREPVKLKAISCLAWWGTFTSVRDGASAHAKGGAWAGAVPVAAVAGEDSSPQPQP